jgi:hypothetical protein
MFTNTYEHVCGFISIQLGLKVLDFLSCSIVLTQIRMDQSYIVGVSTLHGTIIHVSVKADTMVSALKKQCIDESDFELTPLRVNVDLAGLLTVSHPLAKYEGVRLVTLDGSFLQDDRSIGSQVTLAENIFLFKLVFMKQHMEHFTSTERTQMMHFADAARKTSGYILHLSPYNTPFVVMPVWGGVDRPNAILGLFYQHKATAEHARLMSNGVDPRFVDMNLPRVTAEYRM